MHKQRWVFDTPKGRFSGLRKVEDPLWTKPEWVFVEAGEEIPIFAEDVRRFQRGVLGKYALYFGQSGGDGLKYYQCEKLVVYGSETA